MIRITHVALACCGLLALAAPAHAQLSGVIGQAMQGDPSGGINSGKNPDARFATPAPPPALPGSRTARAEVAPLQRDPNDMNPTEALFDAVNRGDQAAARAAIARGADLNAKNILGLTPADLSVDLGRSQMTFMLLSMRGAAPASIPGAGAGAGAGKAGGAKHPPVSAAPLSRVAAARPAAMPAPVPEPRPAPRPRVLASEAAVPRPSVGFLGFGSR